MNPEDERKKVIDQLGHAIDAIEATVRAPGGLPSGVHNSHLKILRTELEQARASVLDGQIQDVLSNGDSRRLILDMWPFDYELGETILGAYQAMDALGELAASHKEHHDR